MGFGFGGGCGCNDHRELPKRKEQIITENNDSNPGLLQFLRTLAPGTCLVIQYDCQPPTRLNDRVLALIRRIIPIKSKIN
ncbi:hypothetical protein ACX16B_32150, partial [Bacillus cereus]